MLTAAPCQPMPGPLGAVWPSAKPGIEYCGPYPACCPAPAPSWWQQVARQVNPHGDWPLISLEAFLAVLCVVLLIAFLQAASRARAQRRLQVAQGRS